MDRKHFTGSGETLSAKVYESLREDILSQAHKPGSRIVKKEIADKLEVSLFPVGEAVNRLADEGLLQVVPQAGTFVSPISMDEILEGSFLREALECASAERVAEIATKTQVAELERNFSIQEFLAHEGDSDGFFEMDDEMHRFLLRATGFSRILPLSGTLWLQVERARRLFARTPGSALEALEEHRAIVQAIVNKRPEAARLAMKAHITRVTAELLAIETQDPDLLTDFSAGTTNLKSQK